ncbi:MAG TPA: MFS transporter [Gaiellales bacterium]
MAIEPRLRGIAFWSIASIIVLFMSASSAPTPLYVVYQHDWGFSNTTLTVIFAVYVLALLGSLLVVGALSDHIGRRPVLAAAIVLEAVALVLFVVAGDVLALSIARVLQGIATGAAITTLGASLVDLNPPEAPARAGVVNGVTPIGGLAFGALATGALVQWAPSPRHLVYLILLAGMAVALAVVARLPESSPRRPGAIASLAPRLGIPAHLRVQVLALLPIFIASWALGGLYLSLGPSVAASIFGLESHFEGGVLVALLCGTGAATAFALRAWPAQRLLPPAAVLLAAGMVITLVSVEQESVLVGIIGTLVAGVGFGAAALACFGTLARIALPTERGELFAVAYTISYIAFSVPAVAAGFASTRYGLHRTTIVYGIVVLAFALSALAAQRIVGRRATLEAS